MFFWELGQNLQSSYVNFFPMYAKQKPLEY